MTECGGSDIDPAGRSRETNGNEGGSFSHWCHTETRQGAQLMLNKTPLAFQTLFNECLLVRNVSDIFRYIFIPIFAF